MIVILNCEPRPAFFLIKFSNPLFSYVITSLGNGTIRMVLGLTAMPCGYNVPTWSSRTSRPTTYPTPLPSDGLRTHIPPMLTSPMSTRLTRTPKPLSSNLAKKYLAASSMPCFSIPLTAIHTMIAGNVPSTKNSTNYANTILSAHSTMVNDFRITNAFHTTLCLTSNSTSGRKPASSLVATMRNHLKKIYTPASLISCPCASVSWLPR
jgi:hypothetical protein